MSIVWIFYPVKKRAGCWAWFFLGTTVSFRSRPDFVQFASKDLHCSFTTLRVVIARVSQWPYTSAWWAYVQAIWNHTHCAFFELVSSPDYAVLVHAEPSLEAMSMSYYFGGPCWCLEHQKLVFGRVYVFFQCFACLSRTGISFQRFQFWVAACVAPCYAHARPLGDLGSVELMLGHREVYWVCVESILGLYWVGSCCARADVKYMRR